MKGLKKYFSPPGIVEKKDNGKVAKKESKTDKIEESVVNNNEEGKDLIVKNMEEVLKSISKKRKREKHKRRHHKDKKRSKETKDDEVDKKLEENPLPDSNKENIKKQSLPMNAFQVMMNASKKSMGTNSNGIEESEANTSKNNLNDSQNKRKRKEMLQEWADAKGGRSRQLSDEAGANYVKKQLQKRATRLKKLLTSRKKNVKVVVDMIEDSEEALSDSEDDDFDPKSVGKVVKKGTKRRKINFDDVDEDSQELEQKNFTSKLRSPLKKRDSLLGYFAKVNKNDEEIVIDKTEVTPSERKSKRGRPKKQEKQENFIQEPIDIVTPVKSSIKDDETPGSGTRPRRSCTLAPRSYKFESPPSDKKKQNAPKIIIDDPTIILSDENSSEMTPPLPKLASIFHKKVPKPALDPIVLKARLDFLVSGLPETIRQEIDRQKDSEELYLNDVPWCPVISHVTQLSEVFQVEKVDWALSKIKVGSEEDEDWKFSYSALKLGEPIELKQNESKPELSWCHVKDRKATGRKLKLMFETFPTYKCFHQLHQKQRESQEGVASGELFTERYKPVSSEQFLINGGPVATLKRFLSAWKESKSVTYDSCDDFEESNSRSSISSSVGSNVILIHGPCGSGKTSSVLALAAEMHFNVLEINAGSKRTGKKMLQELQEATQSHQLRKGQKNREKLMKQEENKKISLILIEDADVIFEQDDGFISGISQLVSISKRPVILTAINPHLAHLSSYLNQNSIEFRPPSPVTASKYLTIMCLAENYIVNDHDLRKLYEMNNGDLRKTVLQIQFYLQTGGDLKKTVEESLKPKSTEANDEMIEIIPVTEDDMQEIDEESSKFSTTSYEDRVIGAPIEHQHCLYNFFGNKKRQNRKKVLQVTDFDFISSCHMIQTSPGQVPDRLTFDMNEEILEFLSYEESINNSLEGQKKVQKERPKLCESLPNCLATSRDSMLDYEPILRGICRTEKQRLANERKGSRFYHYLRNLNPNNFSKDYFDQFTNIFNGEDPI